MNEQERFLKSIVPFASRGTHRKKSGACVPSVEASR